MSKPKTAHRPAPKKTATKKAPAKAPAKAAKKVSNLTRIMKMSDEAIKKRNEKFNKLSPMQKRVAVAEEVILMLKAKQFVAGDGYGRELDTLYEDRKADIRKGEVQKTLVSGIVCEGCAKAGIFIAKASLGNDVQMRSYLAQDVAHNESRELFGDAADIIEDLYEDNSERTGFDYDYLDQFWGKRTPPSRYGEPKKRMLAIFESIVKNKGCVVIGNDKY